MWNEPAAEALTLVLVASLLPFRLLGSVVRMVDEQCRSSVGEQRSMSYADQVRCLLHSPRFHHP